MRLIRFIFFFISIIHFSVQAENGYDLWLRYQKIEDQSILRSYQSQISTFSVLGSSETSQIIRSELQRGLSGMLDTPIAESQSITSSLVVGIHSNLTDAGIETGDISGLQKEGFIIRSSKDQIIITASDQAGLLYGTFHLLRLLQMNVPIEELDVLQNPQLDIRVLNHWDNLDRTSERGYAGFSIWDWHRLPGYIDQRYIDYARANASIGINGTVLTNVNANAWVLTPGFLTKVKALADLFRPYGIRVYLTARFSAPIELGGLETADPLDPDVKKWWNEKVKEIYSYVPDFGGFLVKANSEGQPGPQNYGRSHADGANMLADALAPFNGVVMWRAFVYSNEEPVDRAKQAYNEFKPLDGTFRENVFVQVKNGPIDFQPREPYHPLFGAMPKTPLMMEFQITQEYLGQATQLVYLAPMYKEVLDTDTYVDGEGSTVAKVIDGSLHKYPVTGMAGVANIGTDINWTGHPFGQANWYAFGRLAWNPQNGSAGIANEWIRQTFGNDPETVATISDIMLRSWEAAVNYMTPLGLHHQMGPGHHYGPGPWVSDMPRADWTSVYHHKADKEGIGFDRSKSGSNAVEQLAKPVAKKYGTRKSCPENLLLWFHHVPWDYEMQSGRTLWDELAYKYQWGVNETREMKNQWLSMEGKIDSQRFEDVRMLLAIQEKEAVWWKDASLTYFQTFSELPFPSFIDPPEKSLEYYKSLIFPYAPGIRPRW